MIPDSGSVGGGRDVTIAGWGFSNDTLVTIGGKLCTPISSTYSEITCVPPGSGSPTIESSKVDIEVFVSATGRPGLKLQAGSVLRASKFFLCTEEILHTARPGLSLVVLDLEQYKPLHIHIHIHIHMHTHIHIHTYIHRSVGGGAGSGALQTCAADADI